MRRVAFASCAGTTIEFYDFFVYGTAAALVFRHVFFPALGTAAGTVASFAVAFVARPGEAWIGASGNDIGSLGHHSWSHPRIGPAIEGAPSMRIRLT
jgi:hypothetical protein